MKTFAAKIQNDAGLFSAGGSSPRFTKRGKTWSSSQALSLHLAQFKAVPSNWIVVITESEGDVATVRRIPSTEILAGIMERRAIREEKERVAREKRKIEHARRELAEATARLMKLTSGK